MDSPQYPQTALALNLLCLQSFTAYASLCKEIVKKRTLQKYNFSELKAASTLLTSKCIFHHDFHVLLQCSKKAWIHLLILYNACDTKCTALHTIFRQNLEHGN